MREKSRWIWAALGALLLLGFAAPALAETTAGDCREECQEARVTCHAAAHRAYRVCHEACSENDGECRRVCTTAFRVARARCAEERLECRLACSPHASCDCVGDCAEGLRECRAELHGCVDECREDTRDALRTCRELAQNGAPPQVVRVCVHEAEQAGYQCGLMCQGMLSCGRHFSDCVGECREQ